MANRWFPDGTVTNIILISTTVSVVLSKVSGKQNKVMLRMIPISTAFEGVQGFLQSVVFPSELVSVDAVFSILHNISYIAPQPDLIYEGRLKKPNRAASRRALRRSIIMGCAACCSRASVETTYSTTYVQHITKCMQTK